MGSSRTEQKAATRETILRIAERLFGERGLFAVSTADVARVSGISHGALFVHFPRREDLQQEVISRVGYRIAAAVHEAAGSGADLDGILRSHLQAIAREEAFYSRLLAEGPMLGIAARSAVIGVQSAVAHHLIAEQALPVPDGDIWFNAWLGLVHHYILNRDLFAPEGSVVEKYGERLIEYFCGIVSRSGGEK
ncbi:MAG TPA: TetR/AcrR family transcriptional regulator [Spirochaetia bacterium]|nr:TetR/AcrR family transcriptional regulator [Spirochaetia bacterium]